MSAAGAGAAERFDAIVIGTGQAGPSLAARLAGAGKRVAIIERGRIGGTCVNTGCIPTKTLVASAAVARSATRAGEFGVKVGPVAIDMKKVKARKDAIVAEVRDGNEDWLEGTERVTLIKGHARFESAQDVRVDGRLLTAEQIFINVGGRAATNRIEGVGSVPFWTNSSMMDVDFVPAHLVIVGGSYIGLEFAQMYRRFGSAVTVIEMSPRLIGREDEDVSTAIREIVEAEGIAVRTSAQCISVEKAPEGVRVRVDCQEGSPAVEGTHLLLAVGRRPNTDDLGLDKAGVSMDPRGYITVDDQLRTSVEGIWALGDCNGRGAFTHTAYNDFEIVAANLLDNDPRRVSERIETYGLFIDPPLGRCGMTETAAKAAGKKILVGKRPMTKVKRAVEKGETQGFMKVVVDADSKQILGAAILGVGGDEVIHSVLDVMYARAPYTLIQRAMHIHPTVSELLPTVFGELKPA
jgi:pyruvate/2-oxoglutarate dehydrogenase complex dihydrolipoamide dehydrogenase (E3) component